MRKGGKQKRNYIIYVKAFHNILGAMQGLRLFDHFGFNLPAKPRIGKRQTISEYELLKFDPQLFDWVTPETGALLTLYKPEPGLLAMLEGNMDRDLE